ncbi:hypothetical protein [Janthinobacterium sp. 17J80-10]|uniref:hypothetical protein n=1 Tax=Janthinobacterium sp. 17J80-10 TaxID=2497863 RepID=UPI001005405D|nr:hypothetical protein [Janthinobacterium sp. 17J80-10]QAU33639.1 hypothetical protein EKL02_05250 [Janthinobacterium sp. 17J80-10]
MQRLLPQFALLISLILTAWVYFPGTAGYFTFDDTINIVNNDLLRIESINIQALQSAAFSGEAGQLGRPLSMLSFALNYYFSGFNPYYFKLTNIVIHLLNGLCIFILTSLLLNSYRQRDCAKLDINCIRWVSLSVATVWLLHPLNLTGVLYIVQRMTSLAALFTLLGLIAYVYGRRSIMERSSGWIWIVSSFAVFTPLAIFSKENGVLLPVFLFLIELVFFRFQTPDLFAKRLLMALFGIIVIAPLMACLILIAGNPAHLTSGYAIRDFTLSDRVMTEARIVWFYIRLIFVPDITEMGLYHDDIPISRGLLAPVSTLFALTGIFALAIAAIALRKRHPVATFGILFFLIGHSLESSVLALELVHEHRNYLPDYGLLFVLFYYLLYPYAHIQSLLLRRGLVIAIVLLFGSITFLRAHQWSDPVVMKEKSSEHHPNSIRSHIDLGAFYAAMPASTQDEANEFYRRAYEHFAKAAEISRADTLGLFRLIALNAERGIPIEEAWVRALAGRIERNPFSPNTGNSLANLQKCMTAGKCKIPNEAMKSLIEAALRNPTLKGKPKTQVLFTWSDFLFNFARDKQASATAAYEAVNNSPNYLEFHVTLIHFLINMGQLNEAQQQIHYARQLDNAHHYAVKLDMQEKRIASIQDGKEESGK